MWKKWSIRGPFLIIAPLSTIPHWKREFNNWTDINAVVRLWKWNSRASQLSRTY
jgi:SNF2 family DNA or RNA helicase